jgi:Vam6/Vps39-like protein vacuolar protein sorting-associated protein 39
MKKGLSRKPVTQLKILPDLKIMLSLSDGAISVHDLTKSITVIQRINHKNVQCFCVDTAPSHRLCVVIHKKKKLLLYRFAPHDSKYIYQNELIVPKAPDVMAWHGNTICTGYATQEYTLMDCDQGDVKSTTVPSGPLPCLCVTGENELVLALDAGLGVTVTFNGDLAGRNTVDWSGSPSLMTCCGHYIVAFVPPNTVVIYSLIDQKQVQKLSFDDAIVVAVNNDQVLLASNNKIVTLEQTPIEMQIDQYVRNNHVDEAKQLFDKLDPTPKQVDEFNIKAALALMANIRFAKAMRFFALSSLDPREVLHLYDDLRVTGIEYTPSNIMSSMQSVALGPIDGEMTIGVLVQKGRARMQRSQVKHDQHVGRIPRETLLRTAYVALSDYLWRFRSNKSRWQECDAETRLYIDTVLLTLVVDESKSVPEEDVKDYQPLDNEIFVGLQPAFSVRELLLPKNDCVLKPSEEFLAKQRQYNTLALLYQSKGMRRKALDVWSRLGTGVLKESVRRPDGKQSNDAPSMTEAQISRTDGIRHTVALLSEMDDDQLVWEFSDWVLRLQPSQGLKIFTSTSRTNLLPAEKVIHHLKDMKASSGQDYDYVEHFLDYLVFQQGVTDAKHHDMLAMCKLNRVLMLQPGGATVRPVFSRVRPGEEPGLLGEARKSLLRFLTASAHYHEQELISRIGDIQLYEELIILYSRLGRHADALKVFIYKLKDHAGAAKYCVAAGVPHLSMLTSMDDDSSADRAHGYASGHRNTSNDRKDANIDVEHTRSDLFIQLLGVYFQQKNDYARAYDLLRLHSKYIDPARAMQVIPPDISIAEISQYLRTVIPRTIHRRRHLQIVKSLAKMDHLETNVSLVNCKRRVVDVNYNTICPECTKPIGDKVFSLHPSQSSRPVHYHCAKDYNPPGHEHSTQMTFKM